MYVSFFRGYPEYGVQVTWSSASAFHMYMYSVVYYIVVVPRHDGLAANSD